MRNRLTDNQLDALKQIAIKQYAANTLTRTLDSLLQRGLIEQTGDWYYMLTDAGVEALKREGKLPEQEKDND